MRYNYNEDPQVKFWKDKYDSIKPQNEELKNDVAHLELKVNSLEKQNESLSDMIKTQNGYIQELELELRSARHYIGSGEAKYMEREKEVISKFNHFNSLPWYEKIFFRF